MRSIESFENSAQPETLDSPLDAIKRAVSKESDEITYNLEKLDAQHIMIL
jgi:hypothetical protein